MKSRVVLQLDPKAGNARNSEGAFVTLKSGRILFAYSRYGGHGGGDDDAAVIASRYSDDAGKTWSTRDEVVVRQEGTRNVMSVSLLRLKSGRIALLNLRKDAGTCMPQIRFSDDEARTWGKPIAIMPLPTYNVVNNDRMIELSDGRLVIPVGQHRDRGFSGPAKTSHPGTGMDPAGLIFYYMSDDGGEHWFESLTSHRLCFPNGHGLQEPGVIELRGGRLWSWARASTPGIEPTHAFQWQSFSDDRGMTWSEFHRSGFRAPCSPLSMKRIPSTGDLLAIWNNHADWGMKRKWKRTSWARTPLTCAVSRDDGATWRQPIDIETSPSHGFCYTAIHFVDDAVLLGYCAGGASTGSVLNRLRIRRIPLKEFYAD